MDTTKGLLVRIRAREGKEAEVEQFLNQGRQLVEEEPSTARWFAVRFGSSEFGIFDAFPDEEGRQAHLNGKVAEALMQERRRADRPAADRAGRRDRGAAPL